MVGPTEQQTRIPAVGSSGGGVFYDRPDGAVTHLTLIDGLRGIAALSVVMLHYYHFFYRFPSNQLDPRWWQMEPGFHFLQLFYVYGLYAVNIFWMISGFVFAHVYCGSAATTRAFVVNRLARLYPLHLLTLVVLAGLQIYAVAKLGFWLIYGHNDLWHFVLHLGLASNWGFDREAAFNAPIWSVSVEIVVYALFWAVHRWLHRIGAWAAFAIMAVAGALLVAGSDNMIVACTYYYFGGSALALLWRKLNGRDAIIVPLSLMLIGVVGLANGNAMLEKAVGITGFFGGLIMLLAALEKNANPKLQQICTWLGDSSYGAYLWHVPMQVALILLLWGQINIMTLASQWWFLLLWILAVVGVARVSLVWFERPMRGWLRRKLGG
jgi:peptidoglycan/LPS O-acetylase OafA/YrhL